MIIIFGTRPYFGSARVVQHGFCAHCDQFTKLKSSSPLMFFHLYYLPVIPTRGRRRHHKACSKCNVYQEFEVENYEQVTQSMKDHAADAVVALQSGEEQFVIEGDETGEPTDCVAFLHGAFDWLYAAGENEYCEGLLSQLRDPRAKYASHVLTAAMETMRGRTDAAIESLSAAAASKTDVAYPHQQRAHLLVVRKRRAEAIEAYKAALAQATTPQERLPILLQMVPEQMTAKQFAEAAASYDEIVSLSPELAHDKAIAKSMKKAKKKAGLA
ncbi:tetratricopeptide repeat protein [Stieleria varia]|uniref:Tetratricopeptide repeat protein n=1 Tax=Stieleria varia TaxID=2528005 RepID=A0A5C6AGW4_9BACT|nr:hypothetical protein [Stieleria varia]TWT98311.1 hypothetical protein Pla52n_48230 [Stieleria varia]